MFVERDDVVLLPDMYWGNYNMIFGVRRGATIGALPILRGQTVEGLTPRAFAGPS